MRYIPTTKAIVYSLLWFIVDCGDLGTPDNGDRNFTAGRKCCCNTGFETAGNLTQTCEVTPNGVFWSSTRPQCMHMFGDCNTYKECMSDYD